MKRKEPCHGCKPNLSLRTKLQLGQLHCNFYRNSMHRCVMPKHRKTIRGKKMIRPFIVDWKVTGLLDSPMWTSCCYSWTATTANLEMIEDGLTVWAMMGLVDGKWMCLGGVESTATVFVLFVSVFCFLVFGKIGYRRSTRQLWWWLIKMNWPPFATGPFACLRVA